MQPSPLGIISIVGYVATILLANFLVARFGTVPVGFGLAAPAAVYAVGLALTLRDVSQLELGRVPVIVAIIVGAGLSFLVAPSFALASGAAFLFSEFADFAIYTPLERRNWPLALAASNAVGLVIDSLIFLWIAFGSLAFLAGQIVGKAEMTLAALAVLAVIRGRLLTTKRHDADALLSRDA
jgi:queuosine precursor transporter